MADPGNDVANSINYRTVPIVPVRIFIRRPMHKAAGQLGHPREIVPDHLSRDKLTEGSEELPLEVSVIDSDS